MMIVPIHQRLHWGNIPWMSVVIALVCIWIFAVPQQRDNQSYEEAFALYETLGLQEIEEPLGRYNRFGATAGLGAESRFCFRRGNLAGRPQQ